MTQNRGEHLANRCFFTASLFQANVSLSGIDACGWTAISAAEHHLNMGKT